MKALRVILVVAAIWICLQVTCFSLSTDTEVTAANINKLPIRLTFTIAESQPPGTLRYTISVEGKSPYFANLKPVVSLTMEEGRRLIVSVPVLVTSNGSKWEFSFFVSKDFLDGTRVDIDFPFKPPAPGFDGFWFKLSSYFTK